MFAADVKPMARAWSMFGNVQPYRSASWQLRIFCRQICIKYVGFADCQ
jgi:hypothetical protein